MAPEGKHCLHAYLPATEPYHLWKGLKKGRYVRGRHTCHSSLTSHSACGLGLFQTGVITQSTCRHGV